MLTFVLVLASIVAAVVPMVGFLWVAWWLDRYDREPVWLVLMTFAWGALIATLLSLVGNTLMDLAIGLAFGPAAAGMVTPVLVAPAIEEPTKAAILLLVVRSRRFDNATDGIVYGVAAGLGFGMTENLLYFITAARVASFDPLSGTLAWAATVFARTFFSALMHASASALVGAALGLSRFWHRALRPLGLIAGLALAMGMHALWNGLLTAASVKGMPSLVAVDFALFPFELLGVFLLFQLGLWQERRILRRELEAEAHEHGTLPLAHIPHLASWRRRALSHFAPRGVDQAAYIRAATALGFRRGQLHAKAARVEAWLERDLLRLRQEIRGILQPPTS